MGFGLNKTLVVAVIQSLTSIQFSHSVMYTLCDPMDCSTLGFPVHQQLPEFTQTHAH